MGLLLECCLILLAWSCTVLAQLSLAAESSLVQPPCCVWKTAAYRIPPRPLAPICSTPFSSTFPESWGSGVGASETDIDVPFRVQRSRITCSQHSDESWALTADQGWGQYKAKPQLNTVTEKHRVRDAPIQPRVNAASFPLWSCYFPHNFLK